MTFETSMTINGDDLDIRGEFNYWRGFVSRDRTEPDEPRGWILDESTVEVLGDDGWYQPIGDMYDKACTCLQENMDEPFPGPRGEDY